MPRVNAQKLDEMKAQAEQNRRPFTQLRVKLTRPLTWENGSGDEMYIAFIPKGMTGTCRSLDRYAAKHKSEISVSVSWDMVMIQRAGFFTPHQEKWWEYDVDPNDIEFLEIRHLNEAKPKRRP